LHLTRAFLQLSRCVFVFRTNAKLQSTNICSFRFVSLLSFALHDVSSLPALSSLAAPLGLLGSVCIVSCLTTDDVSCSSSYSTIVSALSGFILFVCVFFCLLCFLCPFLCSSRYFLSFFFLLFHLPSFLYSRPTLKPTQPPIQWAQGALFPRIKRSVRKTNY
jgi:hypothetical protein